MGWVYLKMSSLLFLCLAVNLDREELPYGS